MKHIKTYKIFESIGSIVNGERERSVDFEDCFVDLKHDDFVIDFISGESKSGSKLGAFIYKQNDDFYFIDEVKDVIDFATSYGKSIGINFGHLEACDSDGNEYTWNDMDIDIIEYFTKKTETLFRRAADNSEYWLSKIQLQYVILVYNVMPD